MMWRYTDLPRLKSNPNAANPNGLIEGFPVSRLEYWCTAHEMADRPPAGFFWANDPH